MVSGFITETLINPCWWCTKVTTQSILYHHFVIKLHYQRISHQIHVKWRIYKNSSSVTLIRDTRESINSLLDSKSQEYLTAGVWRLSQTSHRSEPNNFQMLKLLTTRASKHWSGQLMRIEKSITLNQLTLKEKHGHLSMVTEIIKMLTHSMIWCAKHREVLASKLRSHNTLSSQETMM